MSELFKGWKDCVCPVCGKQFCATPEWAYRLHYQRGGRGVRRVFCSWKCLRQGEQSIPPRKKGRFRGGAFVRSKAVVRVETGEVYPSITAAAQAAGVSCGVISRAARRPGAAWRFAD